MAVERVSVAVEALRARMSKLGWTQTDLAREAGVSVPNVSRWLSGERTPSLEMAFRLERSKLKLPASLWVDQGATDDAA